MCRGANDKPQVHDVQDQPLLVCEAVSIDPPWDQGAATGQNALPRTPLNVGWSAPRSHNVYTPPRRCAFCRKAYGGVL